MPRIETYTLNPVTGEQELTDVQITPDLNDAMEGTADLVAGRATVQSIHAGKPVVITRNQDETVNFGHLYVYTPHVYEGISFEIRSTNTLDAGTVFWQIIE